MNLNLNHVIAIGALCWALSPGEAIAQARRFAATGNPESAAASGEEAIRSQAQEFADAFAKADAAAIAATWTEQAEYYEDSGVELHGRAAIEQAYSDFFAAHPGAKMDLDIQSIRFPSRDLAIEEGSSIVTYAGPELPSSARYQAIHVREDGKWRTAVGREWSADGNTLQELAWLAGQWASSGPDGETHITFEWNASKTALTGTFEKSVDGKQIGSGHQRILFDAQTGQIHSWIFDDEGGHGEALWTHDGNKWLLDASGVAADGTATAATNVLTRLNDNEIMWRSIARVSGDSELAPTDPVKLTRVAPAR